jgi:cellulose synthase/poly-beta-1,6-N-acetylglucosamine synthase-like glycosyltransferase
MREFATTVVLGFNWLVLGYAAAFALSQLLLVGLAAGHIVRTLRRDVESRMDDVFAHPNTPPVAVLVPAFNEERTIVESVRSVLALKYPEFETVVIEDGSTDGTFDALYKAFDLVQVHRVIPERVPVRGRVLSVHVPRDGSPLVVVRKQNAGRCADALNAGLNAARAPLVCMVDADSVIEPHALLHVVRPFVEDPDRVVAAGGVIRPSNGLRLARGSIASVSAPSRLLARIQVVEYLRAFLLGRVGWTWLNGNLIISGAFAIFRREDVIAVGGLSENSLGQDADLVASLHRTMSRQRADYSMVIVPQPVCWTEVPERRRDLARQRRRWSYGLVQVLWRNRFAFWRPRYGRFGMLVLPYHLLFEVLGPVVEVLGVPMVLAAWALGLLNGSFAILAFVMSVGFGIVLSLTAVFLEDLTFHRHERWKDLGQLLVAAVLESGGLRWFHAWWRVRGMLDTINPRRAGWGKLHRAGFQTSG